MTDLVIALAGSQSNGAHLWEFTAAPPAPLSGTYMWTGSAWGAVTGDGAYYDLPTSDGVHFYANKANGLDLKCLARRLSQSVAKALGLVTYSAAGPQIVGARATGSRALVSVAHNGGSVLVPNFNFQPVTGFTAYDPSTGTALPTRNVYCTGRAGVMLEFSSDLGGVLPMIRYQQLGNSDPSNPVYDDNVPSGDTYGCPLMPGVVQSVSA